MSLLNVAAHWVDISTPGVNTLIKNSASPNSQLCVQGCVCVFICVCKKTHHYANNHNRAAP